MPDTPVFQGHHIIEQQAFEESRLLQKLSEQGLFDRDGPHNMVNLPANQTLAAQLDVSPHTGGPLGEYSKGLRDALDELADTVDGQAAQLGDQAAAKRIGVRVEGLTDTLRAGLINGDLLTNTPQGMNPEQANARTRAFFGDLDGYQQRHASQIAEFAKMPALERRWAGVTKSEGNVAATLDAIEKQDVKPVAGDPDAGRRSLGNAIAQANEAGRLGLSESIEVRLRATFPSEMPPTLMRATGLSTSPSMGRVLGAGAAVFGAALTTADGVESVNRASALYDMNNATGARSELIHFGSRNIGAWGGALLGAGFGASVSSPTGPGAIIGGIVGGAVGLVGGTKIAEYLDHRSIYRQEHPEGTFYTFKPDHPERGWRRTETMDLIGVNGQPYEETRETVAGDMLTAILDRQATTVSLELMLARPPVPKDPYTLPSALGDAHSMPPSDWRRDAATGQWQRPLYEWQADASDLGRTTLRDIAIADPARAAQLDAASQAILRDNVHLAPAAMAARYELAYHDKGWKSVQQELPDSAKQALADDGRLVASDGAEYRRRNDGGWQRQALFGLTTADANPVIRAELDATRALLQEGLREHRALMVERPEPVPPSPEQSMAKLLTEAYGVHGLTLPEADVEVMAPAMLREQSARGINDSYMLNLERDPVTRQYGPNSPMGFYTRDGEGDMSLRFTMTPAEARELLAAPDHTRSQSTAPTIPSMLSSLPPDFAPSLPRGRDLRDPQHEGYEAYREMQNKVGVFEAQRNIGQGPHSDQMAASMLQFAVDNKLSYSDLYLEKNQETGQIQLRYAKYGEREQRFDVDLAKMASQPIDASSQQINSVVSPHYGSSAPTLERTQAQSQWMSELAMDDRVSFERVRVNAPGHISDDHVMAMTVEMKKVGMDAASIGQVSMLGDQLRVQGAGEWGNTVLLDVNKPAPPLQDSVNVVNTLNQQQAQQLVQQQNNPVQDDPTPKGPRLA